MATGEKTPGQVAYEAYADYSDWKSLVSGSPLPLWDEPNESPTFFVVKQAWEHAARAVIDYEKERTMTVWSKRKFAALVSVVLFIIATVWAVGAIPARGAASSTRVYKNCAQLNVVYLNGVGRRGAVDRTSSKLRVTRYTVNTITYNANRHLDRDRDGIACERYLPPPPTTTSPVKTSKAPVQATRAVWITKAPALPQTTKVYVTVYESCYRGTRLWFGYNLEQEKSGGQREWLEDKGLTQVVEVFDMSGRSQPHGVYVPVKAHPGGEGRLFLDPQDIAGYHFRKARLVYRDGDYVVRSPDAVIGTCCSE